MSEFQTSQGTTRTGRRLSRIDAVGSGLALTLSLSLEALEERENPFLRCSTLTDQ